MKKLLVIIFLFSFLKIILAQENSASVSFNPYYQNWDIGDSTSFYELTNIFSVNFSLFRNSSIHIGTRYSSAGGDISPVKGFSDTQLSFNYNLENYNLLLDAGVNIPTGKTKLSLDDYETSILISQSIFGLQTPNFGQGTNFFLGLTYLLPLSNSFVVGAGLSYQVRSVYEPVGFSNIEYEPSNEFTATAGFDIKLNETSSLSGDIIGIFYGSDKIDGKEIFSAGNRLMFGLQYKTYFRFDVLNLSLSFRNAAVDKLESLPVPSENEKINPDRLFFSASYSQYLSSTWSLGYNLFYISYQETILKYSGYNFIGAAIRPELKLSPSFKIPLTLKYMSGSADKKPDLTNYDISLSFIYYM